MLISIFALRLGLTKLHLVFPSGSVISCVFSVFLKSIGIPWQLRHAYGGKSRSYEPANRCPVCSYSSCHVVWSHFTGEWISTAAFQVKKYSIDIMRINNYWKRLIVILEDLCCLPTSCMRMKPLPWVFAAMHHNN